MNILLSAIVSSWRRIGWFARAASPRVPVPAMVARRSGMAIALVGLLSIVFAPAAHAHNTITKTTSTATVSPGGTATYTIRDDAVGTSSPVTGIQIQDTLPAGLTYLSTTSITLLNANSTRTAVVNPTAGTATPVWGTFTNVAGTPAGAFQIVFNAQVASTTACGAYTNTVTKIAGDVHTDTNAVNVATVTVSGAPPTLVVTKVANAPTTVLQGGVANYTITVTNTAAAGTCPATGVTLTDALPSGFTYAATGTVTLNGGSLRPTTTTPVLGATNPVWGNFTIPAGGSVNLSFTANVGTSVAGGTYSNSASATTTATGATITPFNGGTSTLDDIIVPPIPALTKVFAASSVGIGQTTTLAFSIDNTGVNAVNRSALAFTDTLRSGIVIANPPAPGSSSCGAPTFTAANATQPFTASAISVTAGSVCVVTLTVRGTLTGAVTNAAADLSALSGLTNSVTPQTLTVVQAGVTKTFGAASITAGTSTSLVFTLTNGSGNPAQAGIALGDTLPTGLQLNSASPAVAYGAGCSGPASAVYASGTRVLSGLSGIAMTAGTASCTVTVAGVTNQTGVTGTCPTAALTNLASNITVTNASTAGASDQCLSVTPAGIALSGSVYADTNHNASLDAGETGTGLLGLYVKIAPYVLGACQVPATAALAVDPSTGAYGGEALGAGAYCLILDNNNSLLDIAPFKPPAWGGTEAASGIRIVTISANPIEPQNFGLYNGSSLSGRVFADTGAAGGVGNDGVQNGGEAGIAGASVSALSGASVLTTTTTDSGGNYTIWLPASTSGTIVITEALPATLIATGGSAGTTGGSYARVPNNATTFTFATGQTWSGVAFGNVPVNTFSTDNVQTAPAGSTVFHPHTFIAGSVGQVTFSTTALATPSVAGWIETIYQDTNCNGKIDGGEPLLAGALGLVAAQTVCIVVKEFVPASAPSGAQNKVTVSASFSYTNASPALTQILARIDTTTVGGSTELVLAKLVRNITNPGAFVTANNASPGDILEYQLTITNLASGAVGGIVINDATPTYTAFVSAACPGTLPAGLTGCSLVQPLPGAQGPVQWTFTGALGSAAQVVVTYQVRVNQ